VKTRRLILLCVVPLLFSCLPKKTEIPMTEAPAGPVLAALEQQGRLFSGLKAIGSVEIMKRGRKRAFDTVGIVVDGRRRFRMEAYGPLGQSLAAIVWNGSEVMLRLPEQENIVRKGPDGLAQFLGEGLDPSEFCAVLSGGIPAAAFTAPARLRCAENGDCILELRSRDVIRNIGIGYPVAGRADGPRIRSYELINSGNLVFRARFENSAEIAHYPLPLRIVIENPQKKTQITVLYTEADVNPPMSDGAFSLIDEESSSTGK